jgi:hypothetical protein
VELGGVGALHAPFPYRKAHTRPCLVQRGRKSGYASVGMTKGRAALPFRFETADEEQQVPPLRFASVGMTLLFLSGTDKKRGRLVHDPAAVDVEGLAGHGVAQFCG